MKCPVRLSFHSSQEGRQMIYLPLLLVNELSYSVKDLVVGRLSTLSLTYTQVLMKFLVMDESLQLSVGRRSAAAAFSSL